MKLLYHQIIVSYIIWVTPSSFLYCQTCPYTQDVPNNVDIFADGQPWSGHWESISFPPVDGHNCSDGYWDLIFSDEFNGNTLDQQKWLPNYPYGSYTIGEPNIAVSPNDYISNIEVSNGTLKLYAKNETTTVRAVPYLSDTEIMCDQLPNLRTFYFTGGMIHSHPINIGAFGPGKFEIRCKIPKIDGIWPSFWLYDILGCGQEIDVFEFGNESYTENTIDASKRPVLTYHKKECSSSANKIPGDGAHFFSCDDFSDDFHIFSVEWDHFKITWRIDGAVVRILSGLKVLGPNNNCSPPGSFVDECSAAYGGYCTNTIMPTNKMYILANLKVSDFSHPGESACDPPYYRTQNWIPLTRGTYPATFEIDYIHVYKRVPLPLCDANDIIAINGYTAPFTMRANNSIVTNGNVLIKATGTGAIDWSAGNYIELNNGFETETDADFTAEIAPCNNSNLRIAANTGNDSPPIIQGSDIPAMKNSLDQTPQKKSDINSNFSITPNPTSGSFTISLKESTQGEVFIYNSLGECIYKSLILNPNSLIDISSRPRGIYFLKVQSADGKIYTQKIILSAE